MKKHILHIVFLILLAISCSDPISKPEVGGLPLITKVSKDTTHVGDTLIIQGKNFGLSSSKSYILINNDIKIPSTNCIEWAGGYIRLEVPKGAVSSTISVLIDNDTSNKIPIQIEQLPPIPIVEVSAGEFMMGSDLGNYDESPVHKVKLSYDLIAMKYEVSQKLYSIVMNSNPSQNPSPSYPVEGVSWLEAIRFCNQLSVISKLDTCYKINGTDVTFDQTAKGWRLPTEAEWEYLCRGNTTSDYSGDLNLSAWYNLNSAYKPHSIGRKISNQFGLADIHGNVWEWCWDFYANDYYANSPQQDPTGPAIGTRRVQRGGGYASGTARLRSSNRQIDTDSTYKAVGFRAVKNK